MGLAISCAAILRHSLNIVVVVVVVVVDRCRKKQRRRIVPDADILSSNSIKSRPRLGFFFSVLSASCYDEWLSVAVDRYRLAQRHHPSWQKKKDTDVRFCTSLRPANRFDWLLTHLAVSKKSSKTKTGIFHFEIKTYSINLISITCRSWKRDEQRQRFLFYFPCRPL